MGIFYHLILDPNNDPDISNMIMSWYFAGFYTGYYQVFKALLTFRENIANVCKSARKTARF